VGAFGDGWSFMIACTIAAAAALLAVGPVRIGDAAEPAVAPIVAEATASAGTIAA
jgi:hypothetical protein